MFLGESHSYSVSDIEEVDSQKLSKRIKYRRKLFNDLRQRFRKEYLSELTQKSNEKSSREPKVGEIVLIGDDNKKCLFWPMVRTIELIPGRDGKIRTVKLKTHHGTVLRPVQRVYPLEIRANENCVTEEDAERIWAEITHIDSEKHYSESEIFPSSDNPRADHLVGAAELCTGTLRLRRP
ncbi:integrase catalytic domain-containing protein [Trichonephila clavipes]|nr:integrase catalytic domain-containing protein [Trichonephila clavipes]